VRFLLGAQPGQMPEEYVPVPAVLARHPPAIPIATVAKTAKVGLGMAVWDLQDCCDFLLSHSLPSPNPPPSPSAGNAVSYGHVARIPMRHSPRCRAAHTVCSGIAATTSNGARGQLGSLLGLVILSRRRRISVLRVQIPHFVQDDRSQERALLPTRYCWTSS
jgi:hypothetical protein